MSDKATKTPRKRRSEEEIERGLMALVQCNGSTRYASELLALDGLDISHETLRYWVKVSKRERYEALRAEYQPKLRAHAAEQQMALAEKAAGATMKMVDRIDGEMDDIPIRDLPGAARNMATIAGIAHDKAHMLDGKPQVRVSIDLQGLLNDLKTRGVEFIDAEATEEQPLPELTAQALTERPSDAKSASK